MSIERGGRGGGDREEGYTGLPRAESQVKRLANDGDLRGGGEWYEGGGFEAPKRSELRKQHNYAARAGPARKRRDVKEGVKGSREGHARKPHTRAPAQPAYPPWAISPEAQKAGAWRGRTANRKLHVSERLAKMSGRQDITGWDSFFGGADPPRKESTKGASRPS